MATHVIRTIGADEAIRRLEHRRRVRGDGARSVRRTSRHRLTRRPARPIPQAALRHRVRAAGLGDQRLERGQIAGAQFLHVFKPRHWINCGQAGPLGWTIPAALGVRAADPARKIVALSGDYDFQFMIEELAVGAQFKLPYIHMVVNNSYLGLIRQSQRGFDMDYCVQLSFENINAPELNGYGVDHVAVVEGLGCKAIRVIDPDDIPAAFEQAKRDAELKEAVGDPKDGGDRGRRKEP